MEGMEREAEKAWQLGKHFNWPAKALGQSKRGEGKRGEGAICPFVSPLTTLLHLVSKFMAITVDSCSKFVAPLLNRRRLAACALLPATYVSSSSNNYQQQQFNVAVRQQLCPIPARRQRTGLAAVWRCARARPSASASRSRV